MSESEQINDRSTWYREIYLKSDHWKAYKQRKSQTKDANKCQMCFCKVKTELHHKTYLRLGHEELGDTVFLCKICHDLIHKNYKIKNRYPINEAYIELGKKWNTFAAQRDDWKIREKNPNRFRSLAMQFFKQTLGLFY